MKKKVKLNDKLALAKETIAQLDEEQLKELQGGGSLSCNGRLEVRSCCNDSCNGD